MRIKIENFFDTFKIDFYSFTFISKAIEDECDNKLDQLSDQNPFPIYLDDVQISNEEKDLIREKRKTNNANSIVLFLPA